MNNQKTKYHPVRVMIPEPIYKKFKVLCAQLDLSIPKQTASLMTEFINIHEENLRKLTKIGE